jgi:fatty acid desaturase
MNGLDATDTFYALHSKEAIAKLQRMHKTPTDMKNAKFVVTDKAKAFREFRKKLEEQGFFERNWLIEAAQIGAVFAFVILGTVIAKTYPLIASLLIGVGLQQAGWLGHDYGHGRGKICQYLNRVMGSTLLGFSSGWWSHKHNTHHCFPNRYEVDVDIHNEPFIHLWFPKEGEDVWYRKFQHIYYPIAYSFLHISWRLQSIQYVLGSGENVERILMFLGYCWYLSLPVSVVIGSVLIGGFLVAIVVTCNHQTEDILPTNAQYTFSSDQFTTTRGVRCDNFVTEYLFGGMQYQLEHHLFPTMPRYYYPKVRPLCKAFADENGEEFKVSSVWEIIALNYQVLKRNAGPLKPNKFEAASKNHADGPYQCLKTSEVWGGSPKSPASPSTSSSHSK